ncbi:hypothetical protein [Microbacterium sp. BH-3-3-3]|uniref:hypothetical protein n=1 Tax=Microbacterium sp. BH-3-3-3 TaxID=1906742 RepID=UPI0011A81BBC|nr:hypothetical protein [Microbacterium sp. BH-3-3-3]
MGTGHTDVLLGVLQAVSASVLVPQDVADEVGYKSTEILPYTRAASNLQGAARRNRLAIATHQVGDDEVLDRWVSKLFGFPRAEVAHRAKDLGETMAVAHAAALREHGERVVVVVDDGGGQRLTNQHGLDFISSLTVLGKAALLGLVPDRATMTSVYADISRHSKGLPAIDDPIVQSRLFADTVLYGSQADRLT